MTFIGRSLDEVQTELEASGYEVEVVENASDRCKEYDAMLVTNALFNEDVCTLTVSPFKLEVDEI